MRRHKKKKAEILPTLKEVLDQMSRAEAFFPKLILHMTIAYAKFLLNQGEGVQEDEQVEPVKEAESPKKDMRGRPSSLTTEQILAISLERKENPKISARALVAKLGLNTSTSSVYRIIKKEGI